MATARLIGGHPNTISLTAPADVEQHKLVEFGNSVFIAGSAAKSGEPCQFAVGGGIYEIVGDPTVGSPGYFASDVIGATGKHVGTVVSKDGTNCRVAHRPDGSTA